MPKLLAIDTSTDACSAALYLDGQVKEDFRVIPRQHTRQLLPMIQTLLDDAGLKVADLDAIAFGRGPGSFAGIRIATGVAQGLAFAAEKPLLPVSTLAAIALDSFKTQGQQRVLAALDARMNELYWATYEIDRHNLPQLTGQEQVSAPDQVTLPDKHGWFGAGSGWCYQAVIEKAVQCQMQTNPNCYPRAACMLDIALAAFLRQDWIAAEDAVPVYLRDEVAWKKKDQQ